MTTTTSTTTDKIGPSTWSSGPKYWEKNVQDLPKAEDGFKEARDIGQARLNYSRLNAVGELSKNDTIDYYKFNAISRGKLRITFRDSGSSEDSDGPLDIDTNKYLKAAGIEVEEDTAENALSDAESEYQKILDDLKLKNVKVQVYTMTNGKEKLVADSSAEDSSKYKEAFESLSRGEYRVSKPQDYYIKVSRVDPTESSEAHQYAIQVQIGSESYKHQYMSIETKASSETSTVNGTTSSAQLSMDSALALAEANSLAASATTGAVTMLSDGYSNISSISAGNKINLFG